MESLKGFSELIQMIITIGVSGAFGYVIGNSLKYAQVVREHELMKQRMTSFEKEVEAMRRGEEKIFEVLQNFREEVMSEIGEIKLSLKDKADRE